MSKTCNSCGTDKAPVSVPYVVHESDMSIAEREKKRLWIALIISWIAVVLVVGIASYERLQYDYVSEETVYQQDGQGTNIIGNSNEVNNGTESNDTQKNTP